jgi:hypothetical protein
MTMMASAFLGWIMPGKTIELPTASHKGDLSSLSNNRTLLFTINVLWLALARESSC